MSRPSRSALSELPIGLYIEGGPKGSTPKAASKTSNTPKRPSQKSSSSIGGPDAWLSPSKRRLLISEGLLSPSSHNGLFSSLHGTSDTLAALIPESPVRRKLFSPAPDRYASSSSSSKLPPVPRLFLEAQDPDETLVVPSSPVTVVNEPIAKRTRHSSLAPSPEILPSRKSTRARTVKASTTTVTSLASVVVHPASPVKPTSRAASSPPKQRKVTTPSSRHYPGFTIHRDTRPYLLPTTPTSLPSSSAPSSRSSSSSESYTSENDEQGDDKENLLAALVASLTGSNKNKASKFKPGHNKRKSDAEDDDEDQPDGELTPRKPSRRPLAVSSSPAPYGIGTELSSSPSQPPLPVSRAHHQSKKMRTGGAAAEKLQGKREIGRSTGVRTSARVQKKLLMEMEVDEEA